MFSHMPISDLGTHRVSNQTPPLEDVNVYELDVPLQEALCREGAGWAEGLLRDMGKLVASARVKYLAFAANRHPPELSAYDACGRRVNEVIFHPGYHELLGLGCEKQLHCLPWLSQESSSHAALVALFYLFHQADAGVCCPLAMSYASIPTLRKQADVSADWLPGVLSQQYDPRSLPRNRKHGLTIGMAMTEKQGGSDLRANTTRAEPAGTRGAGGEYILTGHKWFCSAPMSDAFLMLAQTPGGLSCFLVPRWLPDGSRNSIHIQRLKDKLGNRSNASAEIELHATWARMIGDEGRGVSTIMDMVHHSRLMACVAPASLMRQALSLAIHHAGHRRAFGRPLIMQPLMRNVLADLALECEAAVALIMWVARIVDDSTHSSEARLLSRLVVPAAKYLLNKRAAGFIGECMECLGGNGFIEESELPRLYREAPVNGIWEGSGNILCLDVLRTLHREPGTATLFLDAVEPNASDNKHLQAAFTRLHALLAEGDRLEAQARRLTELMALLLQATVLCRHAPSRIAEAFCATRLADTGYRTYGTLPTLFPENELLRRAWPREA